MPVFRYKAVDQGGKSAEGLLTADSLAAAFEQLRGLALSPLQVAESAGTRSRQYRKRLRARDLLHFTQQLGILLKAKIPLLKALDALSQQSDNLAFVDLVGGLRERINQGAGFSAALRDFPALFSPMYISMVSAGELSGALDITMVRLAEILDRNQQMQARLKKAMTYPCIMLAVMALAIWVLVSFVLPKFAGVFADLGATLPLSTRIVLGVSGFMSRWWWLVALAVAGIVYGLRRLFAQPAVRRAVDELLWRLPLLGGLLRAVAISRFTLTVSLLLESGVPILDAVAAGRDIIGHALFQRRVNAVLDELRQGRALGAALLDRQDVFPPLVARMVAIGEQSGDTAGMLKNASEFYARQADSQIETLSTLMEPLMVVLMGVVAGFVLLAMLMPVFTMSSHIR